jgi:hypothetical protein
MAGFDPSTNGRFCPVHRGDARPQAGPFLTAVRQATRERFKAIGLGEDVRISGDNVVGGALTVDGKVVHLVAFPSA